MFLDTVISTIALVSFIVGLIYLLYLAGLPITPFQTKLYHYQTKGVFKDELRGSCSACTGYTKKILRLKKERYIFRLESSFRKGLMFAQVLDADKKELFRLDTEHRVQEHSFVSGERYYLILKFQKASGRYCLNWDACEERSIG